MGVLIEKDTKEVHQHKISLAFVYTASHVYTRFDPDLVETQAIFHRGVESLGLH